MNKQQKAFLKGVSIIVYCLVIMTALANAMFDSSLIAQLVPTVLIIGSLIVAYISLGDKKVTKTSTDNES